MNLKNAPRLFLFLILIFPFSFLPSPLCLFAEEFSVTTYDQLIQAIREIRAQSQARIEDAVEQEKVREVWETGRLIDEHILQHKERADYDKQVVLRLSRDLEMSFRELYYTLEFARAYPNLLPGAKLSWSHYKALLDLKNMNERNEVAAQAEKEDWGRDRIREEVTKRNAAEGFVPAKNESKLTAQPGKLNTYRVIKATSGPDKGELVLDLGFSNSLGLREAYLAAGAVEREKFQEGDIVQPDKGFLYTLHASYADLYTYKVDVIEVIDGDTFKAAVDLGFGFNTIQTLRLRGLDAPEILSAEGKEAKKFLENHLGEASFVKREANDKNASRDTLHASLVLIRAVKSDKYDRYLVDVFVNGEYINQKLIEQGLAVVVEDY